MVLTASNISKSFGTDIILEDVSFRIMPGEKVGLVGRNGSGKTTLIRMILGEVEPDSGGFQKASGAKIAILEQHTENLTETVWERASSSLQEQYATIRQLEGLEKKMEEGRSEVVDQYSDLLESVAKTPLSALESKVQSALLSQGFDESRYSEKLSELSGGERTRVELARLAMEEVDLLILDEPTNHLDIFGIEDLAKWVCKYKGAVLAVSHNRDFLNKTATKFLDLRERTVKAYPGPLDHYLQLRADYDAERLRLAKARSKRESELDSFVKRFINSQRTAQARGRRRLLERLREENISLPEMEKEMAPVFAAERRSSEIVVETKKLVVGYGSPLMEPIDWTIKESERWAIIGANGSGKSTLIQTLMKRIPSLGGSMKLGQTVDLASFDQTPLQGDLSNTALDYIVSRTDLDRPGARGLLGRFLFSDDDVFKPVSSLSGGERNKLAFAILARSRPNLLIMDEPTNHLDFESRTNLVDSLQDFTGAMIIVSHDSFLLNELADHCLIIKDGKATVEYAPFRSLKLDDLRSQALSSAKSKAAGSQSLKPKLSPREVSKAIATKQSEIAALEQQIASLESRLTELETMLQTPEDIDDLQRAISDHQHLKEEIERTLGEWQGAEEYLAELEAMRSS